MPWPATGVFMSRLEEAVERLRSGGVAVLADEDREGEGVLILAAELAQPETLRVLAENGLGALDLVFDASCADGFAFETGETKDRRDIAEAVLPAKGKKNALEQQASAIRQAAGVGGSGHDAAAFGIVARKATAGGVLVHADYAEGAVDALRIAGRAEVAALRALGLPGGVLARDSELDRFAKSHRVPLFTIQDVIAHRLANETIVESAASARIPSAYAEGSFEVQAFRSLLDGSEHLAMVRGPLGGDPLVRIHSECLTGDALGSLRCDCGDQLRRSLKLVAENPAGGAVIYLRGQEGRGIGLVNKIRAYALQDLGRDTVQANVELGFPPDLRDYGVAIQILRSLGIGRLRLLSNNPLKAAALERYGIRVAERVPLRIGPNPHNARYLETKRLKLGHDLSGRGLAGVEGRGDGYPEPMSGSNRRRV